MLIGLILCGCQREGAQEQRKAAETESDFRNTMKGRRLGAVDFDSNTSETFHAEIQAPWFAYWLKDKGELDLPEAKVFRIGENIWEAFDEWPPQERIERQNLYLHANGRLTFEAPSFRRISVFP